MVLYATKGFMINPVMQTYTTLQFLASLRFAISVLVFKKEQFANKLSQSARISAKKK